MFRDNRRENLGRIGLSLALMFSFGLTAATAQPTMTDQEITDAVEDELLYDLAVTLPGIDVQTTKGIVTLSGTTDSLLAKERAARLARAVRGVRAVVNEMEVTPAVPVADAALKDDVRDALLEDPATESYEADITVQDGKVTLSGEVDSWQERALAEKVAKGVRGVKAVQNDMRVEYETERPDAEIRAEIEKALEWDVFVDDGLVRVDVEDGNVTLRGTVGSASEKVNAVGDAWVAGVESVNANALKVERWARDADLRKDKYVERSDADIREAVKDALAYDPRVFFFNVTPEVESGVVTLRGEVDNVKAKRAAVRAARNTVGVVSVVNRIKVKSEEVLDDSQVEQNVQNALARDPYVDRYDITVNVVNGTANLYGVVDTYFEKAEADDAASRAQGVIEVDNNLTVSQGKQAYPYDPYVDDWSVDDYDWYQEYDVPRTTRTDADIREAVRNQLWWSPFVDEDEVAVLVDNGEVTLTGVVDTWSEYNAATENAYEGGATWVDNNILVR